MKSKCWICAFLGVIALLAIQAAPVRADNVWGLTVGLQAPMFNRAQHASENTPQFVWSGWAKAGIGALKLTSAGQYSLRDDNPFESESKVNVGLEYPLTHRLSVYSIAEDRYRVDQWRYIAGVKFSLGG